MCLLLFVGPWHLFQFLEPVRGRTPWTGDQPVARSLPRHRTTLGIKVQASMPQVGFETPISMFERAKTVKALERAATVIGYIIMQTHNHTKRSCI
jgi:hypothetical protein